MVTVDRVAVAVEDEVAEQGDDDVRAPQAGAVLTAPEPLPNKEFFRVLREAMGVRVGLPAPAWLLEIGTFLLRTESELVLKSRRAVPTLLLKHNFDFLYPTFPQAARNLVRRLKTAQ